MARERGTRSWALRAAREFVAPCAPGLLRVAGLGPSQPSVGPASHTPKGSSPGFPNLQDTRPGLAQDEWALGWELRAP